MITVNDVFGGPIDPTNAIWMYLSALWNHHQSAGCAFGNWSPLYNLCHTRTIYYQLKSNGTVTHFITPHVSPPVSDVTSLCEVLCLVSIGVHWWFFDYHLKRTLDWWWMGFESISIACYCRQFYLEAMIPIERSKYTSNTVDRRLSNISNISGTSPHLMLC